MKIRNNKEPGIHFIRFGRNKAICGKDAIITKTANMVTTKRITPRKMVLRGTSLIPDIRKKDIPSSNTK